MKLTKILAAYGKPLTALSVLASGFLGWSFAADPTSPTDAMSFQDIASNVSGTGNDIMKVLMVIVTIAGILLVLKGLVHLKQNYTSGGGGQEKHLSKGIASLCFGAALFLIVPITHALVGGLSGGNNVYNQWDVANYYAGSLADTSANPS